MKFTSEDFLSAATKITTVSKRKRPTLIDTSAGKLRLPVAPSSPLFNEDINTEPFPDYEEVLDSDSVEHAESLHCVLHCKEDRGICKWLVYFDHKFPDWKCAYEKEKVIEPVYRPPLHVEDKVIGTLRSLAANAVPSQQIDIHYTDAQAMMAYLENYTTAQALRNQSLIQTMLREFQSEDVSKVLELTETFFAGMHVYFYRTLSEAGYRTLTIYQLRLELNVYLWTMLQDWVEEFCDERT
jgi:hypothetical protein